MRTRGWRVGLVVLGALALLGGWLLLRSDWRAPESDPARAARPTSAKPLNLPSTQPRPPQPGAHLRIRGTVVDVHGAPVAGAHVSASWPEPGQTLSELPCPEPPAGDWPDARDSSDQGEKLPDCMGLARDLILELVTAREGEAPVHAQATTAADGTFVLEGLPEGPLALWALAEHGVALRPGIPAGTEGVELVLEEGRVVEGRVLGDGAPLAGATVTVFDAEHPRFFDATTDAEGRFHLGPLPWGSNHAIAAHPGWLPELTPVGPVMELKLHRSRPLSGRVLSGGAPVPGVAVRVSPGNAIPDVTSLAVTSDAQGRFSIVLSSDGPHTLSASQDGRHAVTRATLGAAASPEVVLELGSALRVEGRVSDDARRPVAGARVAVVSSDYASILKTVTDAEGRYQVGPVEPGDWSFRVFADRHVDLVSPEERTLTHGTGPVDFTLTRASSVSGRVTDAEGQPLKALELTLVRPGPEDDPGNTERQEETWTDEDGRFVLDADAPGDYRIEVQDGRFLDAELPVRAPSEDVHLTLQAGASVKGTVVDAHGLPLQDFFVEVTAPEAETHQRRGARTDAQGRFAFQGVKPGRYVLLASRETDGTARRAWREVVLAEGPHPDVELRVDAERTLTGVVVDGEGRPIENAFVRARTPQEDAPHWKREGRNSHHGPPNGTPTGPDGRFTVRHLTEAAYDVTVWKDGYTLVPERSTGAPVDDEGFRVGPDTGPLHVVLMRRPHAIGRVVGPDGAPFSDFTVNHSPPERSDGTFALPIDGQGSIQLYFMAEGMATVARVVEQRNRGPDVDLGVVRMAPGRPLRGRVIDAETSAPVEGALIELTTREGTYFPGETGLSDKDGTFTLENLDTETVRLVVSKSHHYRRQRVSVDSSSGEVVVRLDPGARVEVTVKDGQGRLRAASVHFHRDDDTSVDADAPGGRLVQRGLEPGTYTVRPGFKEARQARQESALLVHPQRVVVPASGVVQVALDEAGGGATVKLRAASGRVSRFHLIPGSIPDTRDAQELDRWGVQALIGEQRQNEATFRHVPEGRTTVFFFDDEDGTRFHLEELDIPAGGTLSRELHPVWRTLDATKLTIIHR
ncbi:carboxypeptidase regulatory-like domain-containing protein [Pyxidicoccus xibeiensis]|uniref:carboxypeptidase regulatory-like domain-containing protein n=1 Tax=Pyxidicoccus xibeiensis TaxID=2906759 RepID=UPI0020A82822|nr:carboxypeptidase regulatory-like domain-containing protein [Pyxidicoccus xibeiensis]MCP3136905.1 carboxypeptidase regulatory-like domain-containing protein [Pyxidicoccus xibeiensis]